MAPTERKGEPVLKCQPTGPSVVFSMSSLPHSREFSLVKLACRLSQSSTESLSGAAFVCRWAILSSWGDASAADWGPQ